MKRTLLLLLAACSGPSSPPCDGAFHVCGGQIRDADGRAVILRGMNVSGANKASPYLSFPVTQTDLARMRDDWGMNAMRWVMPWAAIEPTRGTFDDNYLANVRTELDWAAAHGILVILDMHQDVYGEGFGFDGAPRWTCDQSRYDAFVPKSQWSLDYLDPNVAACFDAFYTTPDDFVAAWAHVAAVLNDHPAVLGFDILNEPHWGTYAEASFEKDRLEPFEERVITAVRAAAPQWLAFVEPGSSRNLGFPTSLVPFAEPDIVYAPHTYDALAEQGQGFDPARRDSFIGNISLLRQEADRLGAALWIGEYGGLASDPGIAAYMDAAYDGDAAVAASSMYWDYSAGGYGPIDSTGAEVPAIVDAIVRPYPSRIAGDPIDWSLADDGSLTVHWTPSSDNQPTEIIVPPRLAPNGVDVSCGGCTVTITGDTVSLTDVTEGAATISPI